MIAICEGKLSRAVPSTRRKVRQHRCGCAFGRRHEGILGGTPPGDESQVCALTGGTTEVRKGLHWIAEEHHAEPRHDHVHAGRREGMNLCIGDHERCGCTLPVVASAGKRDHWFGDIHAEATAGSLE